MVRHWWPAAAVGLAALSGILQLTVPNALAVLADLGFAPIFYLLGAHHDRRVRMTPRNNPYLAESAGPVPTSL